MRSDKRFEIFVGMSKEGGRGGTVQQTRETKRMAIVDPLLSLSCVMSLSGRTVHAIRLALLLLLIILLLLEELLLLLLMEGLELSIAIKVEDKVGLLLVDPLDDPRVRQ